MIRYLKIVFILKLKSTIEKQIKLVYNINCLNIIIN